jgi:pterin-4a-carbinolamine dehydratase
MLVGMVSTNSLSSQDVARELASRPGWKQRGEAIVRELTFRDFDDALRFFEQLGEMANDYGRRPEMCIREHNRVRLWVANPHHAGFTMAEMRLADKVDGVIERVHPDAVTEGR